MTDAPKGMTDHQDMLMRMWLEISECPWSKMKGYPSGISEDLGDKWMIIHGYTKDKKQHSGWRGKV